jgi:PAS domain S-box-containing protein
MKQWCGEGQEQNRRPSSRPALDLGYRLKREDMLAHRKPEIRQDPILGSVKFRYASICLLCLSIVPFSTAKSATLAPQTTRQQTDVLFLSSTDPDLPDVATMIDQAETRILEGSARPVHFTFEYLEPSSSFADESRRRATYSYLLEKYRGQSFDLVIAVNEETVTLAEQIRTKLFRDGALVFFVVDPKDPTSWLKPTSGRTGVVRTMNALLTLQLALQQNPGTSHVIVISGSSDPEKLDVQLAREQFRAYESNIEFQYLTDLQFSELAPHLAQVPPDSIILFLDFITDSAGEQFIPARILPALAKTAARPIYGTFSSVVGRGVVGGSVADLGEVGQALGDEGVRILKGAKAENIPVVAGDFQRYVVDWRQLHRWGIPENQIPKGSEVRYWEYSPWELYRWRILGLFILVLIETLLIVLLLRNVARRKRVQGALTRKEIELAEAQRLARVGNWLWDATSKAVTWSEELYRIHGIDPSSPAPRFEEFGQLLTSESMSRMTAVVDGASRTGSIPEIELEVVRPDGSTIWVNACGEAVRDATGRVAYVRGTAQDITDRKKFEVQFRESQGRLTAIVDSAMDAIIAVDEKQVILLFNPSAEKMFGCSASDAVGSSMERFIPQRFRAEHIAYLRHFGETGTTNRVMGDRGVLWALRSNGEEFPIEASISHVEDGGKKLFTVIIRDVTERRRAEEAVAESEKRFRLVANTAPVLIWMAGTDKLCNYFNQPWLQFTGRRLDQELGNGWADGVHEEDLQRCLDTYTRSFDRHEEFRMEYRLRRHDGEYRWVLDIGTPRFNTTGSFAGYVGCCIDITDQKDARAAVMKFSGRLIRAGEEERARIARELHDDINQRLALLANRIQECDQATSANTDSVQKKELREIWRLTNEIATDIQHMSHQLHPSKLHYLGLAATVRHFCKEFSQQHKLEVECTVKDLPEDLDENVSLNLFRTVQESLRNVVKHSQAHHVKVELTCQSSVVQLRVSDDGVGFDPEHARSAHGLGLISMQERLRSVGGEFSIWSKPSFGTQVEGRVPASTKLVHKQAEIGVA